MRMCVAVIRASLACACGQSAGTDEPECVWGGCCFNDRDTCETRLNSWRPFILLARRPPLSLPAAAAATRCPFPLPAAGPETGRSAGGFWAQVPGWEGGAAAGGATSSATAGGGWWWGGNAPPPIGNGGSRSSSARSARSPRRNPFRDAYPVLPPYRLASSVRQKTRGRRNNPRLPKVFFPRFFVPCSARFPARTDNVHTLTPLGV